MPNSVTMVHFSHTKIDKLIVRENIMHDDNFIKKKKNVIVLSYMIV